MEAIGNYGPGTFTQTGGTHAAGSLTLGENSGSTGTYNLDGGLLTVLALSAGSGSTSLILAVGRWVPRLPGRRR